MKYKLLSYVFLIFCISSLVSSDMAAMLAVSAFNKYAEVTNKRTRDIDRRRKRDAIIKKRDNKINSRKKRPDNQRLGKAVNTRTSQKKYSDVSLDDRDVERVLKKRRLTEKDLDRGDNQLDEYDEDIDENNTYKNVLDNEFLNESEDAFNDDDLQ